MCIHIWYLVSMTFFSSYIFSNNCITKMTSKIAGSGGSLSHSEVITESLKRYFASCLNLLLNLVIVTWFCGLVFIESKVPLEVFVLKCG